MRCSVRLPSILPPYFYFLPTIFCPAEYSLLLLLLPPFPYWFPLPLPPPNSFPPPPFLCERPALLWDGGEGGKAAQKLGDPKIGRQKGSSPVGKGREGGNFSLSSLPWEVGRRRGQFHINYCRWTKEKYKPICPSPRWPQSKWKYIL